jgi:hypothetical protein
MRLKLKLIIAISIVALGGTLVGSGATASAQTGAAFDYEPTEGPVDTVITITNGGCDSVQEAGDAIALYRASDGALVDATTQLGNDPANPRPWTTRLIVSPTLLTAAGTTEATTPGDYVVALFCDIGSSFRPPNDPDFPTSSGDADLTQPFVVTEPEPEPEPLPLGVTPTSGPVGTSVTVFGQGCVNEVGPGVVTVLLGGEGDDLQFEAGSALENGSWSLAFTLPESLASGPHLLTAVCDFPASGDELDYAVVEFNVTDGTTLEPPPAPPATPVTKAPTFTG